MTDPKIPRFHPLTRLPLIAHLIDEQFEDTKTQFYNFKKALLKPHVLNDEIVGRAIRLYQSQQEDMWVFKAQIARWREEHPTPEELRELARLDVQLQETDKYTAPLLEILNYLKERTIEKILDMDDAELAIRVLAGELKP